MNRTNMQLSENQTPDTAAAIAAGPGIAPADAVPQRRYKDRVFRMVFGKKKELLELYNALNNSNYTDENELTVTTLENAIYMGMKNDISFMIHDWLMLYEHQATNNPNMPLRDLLYVSNIYSEMVEMRRLYGTKLVLIPEPRFIVFYNGKDPVPERFEQRLSSAYGHPSESPALELVVTVLNINLGYNRELMEKCQALREYMVFVDRVRKYEAHLPLKDALEQAVSECIRENILRDFLQRNRAEVISVCLFEYNEEEVMEYLREEAHEEGLEQGSEQGMDKLSRLILAMTDHGESEMIPHIASDKSLRNEYLRKYHIE